MPNIKNIVVVGTGGGGLALVHGLQKKINPKTHRIVVVEKRDYYAHWPALIRAAITSEGSFDEASLVPNDRVFDPKTVRVVRSTAKSISSSEVTTESGESIPYNYLVLATGSIWTGPMNIPDTRAAALEHLRAFQQELKAAQHVVVVGGGTSGVEYAGEIRHYHPDKKVTIVHGGKELLGKSYTPNFRHSLHDALKKMGAEVVFSDKLSATVIPEGGYVTTANGKRIRADLVVNAIGGKINTEVVKTLDETVVTIGCQNVWALGDIIEWPEQKMVLKAVRGHAPIVLKNLLASIQGGKTASYDGYLDGAAITLGPRGGRAFIPFFGGLVLGDLFVRKMKSEDLRVGETKKLLGY
ncbi:apoptosis-inducing factor A [Ceratobasidium sp. AG-Ba]|nr:apoptosis-inducing factor A [Ceratobasidium sp. AG-Ba]